MRRVVTLTVLFLLLFLASLSVTTPVSTSAQEPVVNILFFHSPDCVHCENVAQEVLPVLQEKYASQLKIEHLDISDPTIYQALLDLEKVYEVPPDQAAIPEIFIGAHVLIGETVIRETLESLIEEYLAEGGTEPILLFDVIPSASPVPTALSGEDRLPEAECRWCRRPESNEQPVVHLYYFYDRLCDECLGMKAEVLDPLAEHYGAHLVIEARDIEGSASNYQLMRSLERLHGLESGAMPEIFIGDEVLLGEAAIRQYLAALIEKYGQQGGVALPQPGEEPLATAIAAEDDAPPIHLAYFHQAGCVECDRVQYALLFLQDRYPQLRVVTFDVREEAALAEWLGEKAGLPQEKRLTAPALFIGNEALVGEALNIAALEALVAQHATSGADAIWEEWSADTNTGASGIAERFRSFGLMTVVAAGLIDGVNPCAFATIIVFVSYMALMGRKGKEILSVGVTFTTGVFLAYMAVGVGLYKILEALPIISVLGRWLYGLTALFCLILAFASLYDYFQARGGRPEDMRLKLPQRLRQRVNKVIRQRAKGSTLAISALVTGVIVSLLELACTGQVYLPTIIFVMGLPELRARAFAYLLLYNLLFVFPLVLVFMFVYHGSNSRQLMRIMSERAGAIKLATTILLFSMAIWLGASLL